MGCASSKVASHEIEKQYPQRNGDYAHHVVFLTSTTYGALKVDRGNDEFEVKQQSIAESVSELKKSELCREEPPEIINSWELMQGIEEELPVISHFPKPPYSGISPRKMKKIQIPTNRGIRLSEISPKSVLKFDNLRTYSEIFDPEVFQKQISIKEAEVEKIVSVSPSPTPKTDNSNSVLNLYPIKCPPGGENDIILYTTTLRGVRKTFDDCNAVRSIIESQNVRMIERDVSMDSGFKEELRFLMGEVRVPMVFVKGRMIGGAAEMVKLEEGGKLGILADGIAEAGGACDCCGGVRFAVCGVCCGSCKVWLEGKRGNCTKCNENGLILCPSCC